MRTEYVVAKIEDDDNTGGKIAVLTQVGGPKVIGQPSIRINLPTTERSSDVMVGDVFILEITRA